MPLDQDALNSLRLDRAPPGAGGPRRPGRWTRLRHRWPWLAAAAVVVLAAFSWNLRGEALGVETAAAEAPGAGGRAAVLNASGYVVARRIATVASKVTGRLVDVDIEEGMQVAEGQVLARLDDATARAAFEVAARQREAAARSQDEIEVRLADAERTLRRNRELAERRLLAASALDAAEAEVAALRARLAAVRADGAVAEGVLRQRRQDLEDLVIRAPFAGVVISKAAQPGEMVSPISAGGGFTRTGIATVVDMQSREIEVDVNEAFIQRVRAGQPAEAMLDAYPGDAYPARVINIVPAADRQRATVRVRIALERLDERVLPDMGVKVRFLDDAPADAPRAAALVPSTALVREGEAAFVWVVEDGRVARRSVRPGAAVGERQGVLEGLRPGETVVVRPVPELREGARVAARAG